MMETIEKPQSSKARHVVASHALMTNGFPDQPWVVLMSSLLTGHTESLDRGVIGYIESLDRGSDFASYSEENPWRNFMYHMYQVANDLPDSMRQTYMRRITELDAVASEDDAYSCIKDESKNDFWDFVMSLPFAIKAGLGLVENGNLSAVWSQSINRRVEIEFQGNQWCEYVIFAPRENAPHVSRVSGVDTLDGVKKQVQSFGLLLFGPV